MSKATFMIGDSLSVLKTLPAGSVDLVMTSPPFLALRSYLPANHPDKQHEIGSEATPGEFIDVLLDIVEECDRVLAPHGSICLELGDTYSGSGGSGGDYTDTGLRAGQEKFDGSALQHRRTAVRNRDLTEWPMAKSLCLIPESFRWALAYGRNPFTGRETPSWRVRNVVRWVRPNPPVGALGDKFRPATSDIAIACKSKTRYFDLDAVRDEVRPENIRNSASQDGPKQRASNSKESVRFTRRDGNTGAPPLDYWVISPTGYDGSHYAVYPKELCVKPIKAMCPERVCTVCGEPSRRIAETTNSLGIAAGRRSWRNDSEGIGAGHSGDIEQSISSAPTAERRTLGWTDCAHNAWRSGVVLDPFIGSGTTMEVATGHGRDALGIDLDERNADLARQRVGMFLTVEDRRNPTEAVS